MSSHPFASFLKRTTTIRESDQSNRTSSTNSPPSTKRLASGSSRISDTAKVLDSPSGNKTNNTPDSQRDKMKRMEETIKAQKATIEALSRDCDRMAVENAELSQATRSMYRELTSQTQWLEGLRDSVGRQAESGRELLKAFRRYKP